jgi:hypothetical protein
LVSAEERLEELSLAVCAGGSFGARENKFGCLEVCCGEKTNVVVIERRR